MRHDCARLISQMRDAGGRESPHTFARRDCIVLSIANLDTAVSALSRVGERELYTLNHCATTTTLSHQIDHSSTRGSTSESIELGDRPQPVPDSRRLTFIGVAEHQPGELRCRH